jgi:hypothetical protein
MTIATIEVHRKHEISSSVTEPLHAGIARCSADQQSSAKQLAHFFAMRHAPDFRYSQRLRRWLYQDAGLWNACRDEHVDAAKALCEEAARVMPGIARVNTAALVKEILRLAEFEPKIASDVPEEDLADELRARRWGLQ